MVLTKSGVKLKNLTSAMAWMLYRLEQFNRVMKGFPTNLTITSINDSQHMEGSRHYTDEAIDIRSHNFEDHEQKLEFMTRFGDLLGPKFTILLENIGSPNEHFHVQVRKGQVFNGVE